MSSLDPGEGAEEPKCCSPVDEEKEKSNLTPVYVNGQNDTCQTGGKRKRKDWRAFANENGGGRRRMLRSDMARLRAEADAESVKRTENGFNLNELEGLDWRETGFGDDLEIAERKVPEGLNSVNKKVKEETLTFTDNCPVDATNCEVKGDAEKKDSVFENGDSVNSESKVSEQGFAEREISTENTALVVTEKIECESKVSIECLVEREVTTENTNCDVMEKIFTEPIEGERKVSTEGSIERELTTENTTCIVTEKSFTDPIEGEKFVKREITERDTVELSAEIQLDNTACAMTEMSFTEPVECEKGIEIEAKSMIAVTTGEEETEIDTEKVIKCENGIKEETPEIEERKPEKKKRGRKPGKKNRIKLEENTTERRFTRSALSKQKENDETTLQEEEEEQEEASGIDQSDVDLMNYEEIKPKKRRGRPPEKGQKVEVEVKPTDSEDESEINKNRELPNKPITRKKKLMSYREDESESEDSGTEGGFVRKKRKRGRPPLKKSGKNKINFKLKKKPKTESKDADMVEGEPRSMAKRKVSDKIKNILLNAGWTIESRPRNGRNYEDQVYIPPHGVGSYWSVTKAYYVFLEEMESVNSKNKKSKFTPIPEEELGLLKRIVVNKRMNKKDVEKKKKLKKNVEIKIKKFKKLKKSKLKSSKESGNSNSNLSSNSKKVNSGKGKRKGGRCTLRVRGSNKDGKESTDNYVLCPWKRTVLSWLIDLEIISLNSRVKYILPKQKQPLKEGSITREGVNCKCCEKTLTVSEFGAHAEEQGSYSRIIVEESGESLQKCMERGWEKQCGEEEQMKGISDFFYSVDTDCVDPNDDTCGICGDGGNLICCDGCPSTFHMNCLGIEMLPSGDWRCAYCSCKFCGKVVSSSDDPSLLSCTQCDERFHPSCVPEKESVPLSSEYPFCMESCKKLFEGLRGMLGLKHDLEEGYSWRVVRRINSDSVSESCVGPLHRPEQIAECHSKIAVALTVMDECFLPINDQRSGVNLIQNVVYSCRSNFVRLNYGGFYTFLLERDDELISAASVRMHGTRLAEMPFIGTRSMYRRQGMCRRLLHGIESALRSLNVERLVIPAITELVETWTQIFGFSPLEGPLKQQVKQLSMIVFPGTGLLQKPISLHFSGTDESNIVECKDEELVHAFNDALSGSKSQDSDDRSSYVTASEDNPVQPVTKSHEGSVEQPELNLVCTESVRTGPAEPAEKGTGNEIGGSRSTSLDS